MVTFLFLLLSGRILAATDDERFLEGLRERRLFKTAQAYCEDRLSRLKLGEVERATLTVEYMLTLSQHALYSPAAEREKLWQAARTLGDKFPADNPRKLVVDLQGALVALAQGELARQEAEASGSGDYATALSLLREATKGLDDLERRVAQQIALQRDLSAPGALTADELFALQYNARYQLARARRNQALCYPAGSDDRVAALTQALEQLGKLKTQLAADEPLMWKLRIDEGICARLLGDYTAAARTLGALLANDVPPRVQAEARAELARIALATGRPAEAQRQLQAGRTSAEMVSAELEFAQLETYVALWKKADATEDTQNAGRYRQQSIDQLAAIENQFGAYWARRGERLVIGSAGAGDENLDILARSADARFLKGEFDDETLQIYDKGAQLALASDLPRYLELAYRAAIVQQKRRQIADAGARLIQLGETLAEHAQATDELRAKAAAAHLLGLRWLAETGDDEQPAAPLIAGYERHLQLWPQSPTRGDAAFALAQLQQQREAWKEAIAALGQVPAGHALGGEAALHAARLTLAHTTDGHAAAETLLRETLERLPVDATETRDAAQALLVVALAGQPAKRSQAETILAQLGSDSPARLLEMLDGLTRLAPGARADVRRELAALQLRAIHLLEPQTARLNGDQRLALARIEAEALLVSGERDKALAIYRQLAQEQPNSAAIQEGYATALAASDDRGDLTQALAQWRIIARRTRPHTERWYQAKYQVALLNYRLGEKDQAAQLIRYLRATPPGLEGNALERQFNELLAKCQ